MNTMSLTDLAREGVSNFAPETHSSNQMATRITHMRASYVISSYAVVLYNISDVFV